MFLWQGQPFQLDWWKTGGSGLDLAICRIARLSDSFDVLSCGRSTSVNIASGWGWRRGCSWWFWRGCLLSEKHFLWSCRAGRGDLLGFWGLVLPSRSLKYRQNTLPPSPIWSRALDCAIQGQNSPLYYFQRAWTWIAENILYWWNRDPIHFWESLSTLSSSFLHTFIALQMPKFLLYSTDMRDPSVEEA